MMLTYQPFFIGGIDDVKKATDNAYGAMMAYIFTFLLCVLIMIKEAISSGGNGDGSTSRRRSGNEYSDIPQSSDARDEYEMNLNLPPSVHEGAFSQGGGFS